MNRSSIKPVAQADRPLGRSGRRPRDARRGFTLLEILLVVFIVALAAGIAVPVFVRSYEGAKLRTSARSVLMSHRYARSVAVLQQKHVAVLYDSAAGKIDIVSLKEEGVEGLDALPYDIVGVGFTGESVYEEELDEPTYNVEKELTRELADGVRITDFRFERKGQVEDGVYWVNYQPNGMCDKYTMQMEDKKNKRVRISIDNLSGSARIEYD